MKKYWFVFVTLFFMAFLLAGNFTAARASVTADCYVANTGGDYPAVDVNFNFTCASAQTVYFGVCDSGFPDDTFTITYKGSIVAESASDGVTQTITIGSATSDAGTNTATVNMVTIPDDVSTYSYAVSSDYGEVADYMNIYCGYIAPIPTSLGSCSETVPIFTQDAAPSDGTLELHLLFGNEGARGDEQIMRTWDINAGDQLNNTIVSNLAAPRYVRIWWQADGSSDWYLLPSQYYHDGTSTADEFGIACDTSQPSYHTAFSSAVAESNVCFDLLNGCD